MSKTTVDVIIPTYNGLPYLKATVESVLAQTHKDLILYVIDDGSTDNGATERYIKSIKDPRVKYFRKENGGQSTARNYGIKISKSPFVALVDADDLWYPQKLEKQLERFRKNPKAGMVYGFHKLIDDDENKFAEVMYGRTGHLFNYLLRGNKISGSGSMVLVRREVFDKVGLFHEDFLVAEDWEMWLRIAKDYEIDCVPEFLASLRVLSNGMQQNYMKMAKGLEYMLPIMVKEFKLNPYQRALVGKMCLKEASLLYFNSGERKLARRAFLRALTYNPFTYFTLDRKWFFVYLRILIGAEWIRSIRRLLSRSYRTREQEHIQKKAAKERPPKVSVVLPVYNGEKYIKAAVDSILEQTFSDFELIIINDGSEDKTQEILDSIKDPRVIKVKQPNKGIVFSLNKAIEVSKGEYIARQDADDLSLPSRIEEEVNILDNNRDIILVGTNAIEINEKDRKIGDRQMPADDPSIRISLFNFSPFVHGSVMFRKSAFKQAGGYRQDYWPVEDFDLWRRMIGLGKAKNIQMGLYKFRINSEGTSQTNLDKTKRLSAQVQQEIAKKPVKVIGSALNIRRSIKNNPDNYKYYSHTALRVARTSIKHLRIVNSLYLLLSISLSLAALNKARATNDKR